MSGESKLSLLLDLKNKIKTGLSQARKQISDFVGKSKLQFRDMKESFMSALSEMGGGSRVFDMIGGSVKLLKNPLTLAVVGMTAMLSVMKAASAEASQWTTSFAKVNVTAQLSHDKLKEMSDEVLAITHRNRKYVENFQDVPAAMNKLVSSGMDVKTAMSALEPTIKAAKAGFTDMESVAGALANTMNSSGVNDASRVYDILFATLNKGNAEFKDVADYLPRIIPMARGAGQSLEDAAGAFAYLTAQGLKSEQAGTALQNVFKALSDSDIINGSASKEGFKGIGVDIFDANGQARNLLDIVADLKTKMAGLTDQQRIEKFDSIGLDSEAGSAINSMIQNYDKLRETIDFTRASQGQLDAAIAASTTPEDNYKSLAGSVQNILIQMGQGINEWWGTFAGMISESFDGMMQGLLGIWNAVSTVLSPIFNVLRTIATVIMNIIGDIVEWIGKSELLKDIAWVIGKVFEGIGWVINKIADGIKWVWNNLLKPILEAIESAYKWVKSLFTGETETDKTVNEAAAAVKDQKPDEKKNLIKPPAAPAGGDKNKGAKSKAEDKMNKVTTGAQQVRNISFNMENMFNLGNLVQNQPAFQNMNLSEFESFIIQLSARVIANVERSYS
jgi:TP901 family phage tail tape measure protein